MVLVGSSVAVSSLLDESPLMAVQALRYLMAAALLAVIAKVAGAPLRLPRGREWLWLAGVAATGLVLFNIALVEGVQHAEPAVIAVAVACVPVILGIVGPLLQGARPSSRVLVAGAVVTAGCLLVEGTGRAEPLGLVWAGVALACEAGFTLLAVPVLRRHGAWGVSFHSVWLGALMFAVLAPFVDGPSALTRVDGTDLWVAVYLAIAVTAAAFLLWYTAVDRMGAGRAGLLTGIAPVSAAFCGAWVVGVLPGLWVWTGIAVVIVGLAFGLTVRTPPAGGRSAAPHPDRPGCSPRRTGSAPSPEPTAGRTATPVDEV